VVHNQIGKCDANRADNGAFIHTLHGDGMGWDRMERVALVTERISTEAFTH